MRAPRAPRARAVARPPTVPRMKAAEDNSSPREPDGTTREGGERARVVSVGSRLSDLTTYVDQKGARYVMASSSSVSASEGASA